MIAIARAFSRTTLRPVDILEQLAMLCGAGLLVFVLFLTYGLDLSPGFF